MNHAIEGLESTSELLRYRAAAGPGRTAFTFLRDGESATESISYGELDMQARQLATLLRQCTTSQARALLLHPFGLEFIVAFFACMYAGVVAVPVPAPDPVRLKSSVPRLRGIIEDCDATFVLTTSSLRQKRSELEELLPAMRQLTWTTIVDAAEASPIDLRHRSLSNDVAFLQYTSGSTASPKGVVVAHANVLANQRALREAFGQSKDSVCVAWLPMFHDMGLIGNMLHSVYVGMHCVLISPLAFLQRPVRWLRAIAAYGGTVSGGPNFAYDLCVERISSAERDSLSLGTWRVAFNGSEPVRAQTLERFCEFFGPCGFRPGNFVPCYGLAEATLLVSAASGGHYTTKCVDRRAYELARAEPGFEESSVILVGSGRPSDEMHVEIVDPHTCKRCDPGEVGEIWLSGPSIASGYWKRDVAAEAFGARLPGSEHAYLRTGDLGFMEGDELFVCDRLKDTVIVRGRKLHPHDIELTVESSDRAVRRAGAIVFGHEVAGETRLSVVASLGQLGGRKVADVLRAIQQRIVDVHEVQPYSVSLISPGSLPRTSSGKLQRDRCRRLFLEGGLSTIAEWRSSPEHSVT